MYRVTRTGRTWSVADPAGRVVEGGFFARAFALAAANTWNAKAAEARRGTNDHAASALVALNAFARDTMKRPVADLGPEDHADAVSDLLADLRHYCDRAGLDFADLSTRALRHYAAECDEARR